MSNVATTPEITPPPALSETSMIVCADSDGDLDDELRPCHAA